MSWNDDLAAGLLWLLRGGVSQRKWAWRVSVVSKPRQLLAEDQPAGAGRALFRPPPPPLPPPPPPRGTLRETCAEISWARFLVFESVQGFQFLEEICLGVHAWFSIPSKPMPYLNLPHCQTLPQSRRLHQTFPLPSGCLCKSPHTFHGQRISETWTTWSNWLLLSGLLSTPRLIVEVLYGHNVL